jgi:hypothetical protein
MGPWTGNDSHSDCQGDSLNKGLGSQRLSDLGVLSGRDGHGTLFPFVMWFFSTSLEASITAHLFLPPIPRLSFFNHHEAPPLSEQLSSSHGLVLRAPLSFRRQVCHFHDYLRQSSHISTLFRLYFTTFPHPAPSPQFLNSATSNPANAPKIRPQPQLGPPAGPSVFKPASPDDDAIYYYFTIDDQLLYTSFYQDWGPLNLAMVYKACLLIHGLLKVRGQTPSIIYTRS